MTRPATTSASGGRGECPRSARGERQSFQQLGLACLVVRVTSEFERLPEDRPLRRPGRPVGPQQQDPDPAAHVAEAPERLGEVVEFERRAAADQLLHHRGVRQLVLVARLPRVVHAFGGQFGRAVEIEPGLGGRQGEHVAGIASPARP